MRSGSEVRARLEVKIWCPRCCEFHETERDKDYENVYSDKCNHIVSVVIKKLGSGGEDEVRIQKSKMKCGKCRSPNTMYINDLLHFVCKDCGALRGLRESEWQKGKLGSRGGEG